MRAGTPVHTPGRVLLVIDQPVLAEVVKLALTHGRFHIAVAPTAEEALAALAQRRPHLAVIDMDLAAGRILDRLGYTAPAVERIPVVALTRRGDLKTSWRPSRTAWTTSSPCPSRPRSSSPACWR